MENCSGDQNTELVSYSNGPKEVPYGTVFECNLNTGRPDEYNFVQMDAILFSYVLV